jgi:hypothetical protein
MESRRLASFLALENEDMFYFPGIHHSFKYGLMTIGGERSRNRPHLSRSVPPN